MEKDEKGYFRDVVELKDGVYEYKISVKTKSPQFELDQWVDVISDIDEENNSVVKIKDGQRIINTYWQHHSTLLPKNHELVIYEMQVADFIGGEIDSDKWGKYVNGLAKVDYFKELGINAIALMPVNEYFGDYNWGYKVRLATESSYGSTED